MIQKSMNQDEIAALYEVSRVVNSSLDLEKIVEATLMVLSEKLGMQRGTLALLDAETGELSIEVAHGLSEEEKNRGRYKVGEGVMGRVLETGEPMIIRNIGEAPLFLDRTRSRGDLNRSQVSFICVPVLLDGETVGVLSADRLLGDRATLDDDLRLLTIIASIVAHAVRVHSTINRHTATLVDRNLQLQRALEGTYRPDNMIGSSAGMRAVFEQVGLVSKSRATVLITGESGTGKELIAKAIHYNSERAANPFVAISCASLPETLLESELFGHERGAFTGALQAKKGRFELAHGGTVFLDEIGEVPAALQVKLLRVLQEREIERLGGDKPIKVDVRILAATNRELSTEVREGRFREDLFYRLNVVPIHLPPLRERMDDLPLLANLFLARFCKENGKELKGFTREATARLVAHDWPGNVRELENAIERIVVMARGELVEVGDLPDALMAVSSPGDMGSTTLERETRLLARTLLESPPEEGVYRTVVDRVEKALIGEAMAQAEGVRLKAAKMLGINRNTLHAKLERKK